MPEQHTPERARTGVDRRKVVRAGVWTVPAVALATAAPALAAGSATSGTLLFDTNGVDVVWDNAGHKTGLHFRVEVQNKFVAGAPTVNTISLVVSVPDTRVPGGVPTKVSGGGWTYASVTHSGGQYQYTFVHTGAVAPGGNTPELDFDLALSDPASGNFSVAFVASATGTNPATGAATVYL